MTLLAIAIFAGVCSALWLLETWVMILIKEGPVMAFQVLLPLVYFMIILHAILFLSNPLHPMQTVRFIVDFWTP